MKRWMEEYEPTEEVLGEMMGQTPQAPLEELEGRRIFNRVMERIGEERALETEGAGERDEAAELRKEAGFVKEFEGRERGTANRNGTAERQRGVAGSRKMRRRTVIAAACIAVMALSAVTFASTMLEGGLVDLLGGSDRQQEIISDMGTVLSESQSVGGYTVALKQMINDRNGCYVLIDVSRDDGQPLAPGYYAFASATVGLPEITASGWYVDQPLEHDGADNEVTLLLHYDSRETVAGKTMSLLFERFGKYTDGELELLSEGPWKFEVPVSERDNTQTFRLNQPVTFAGDEGEKTVMVKTLYLSPISVTMDVGDNMESGDESELTVQMKDGTKAEFSSGGYGSSRGMFSSYTQVDFRFDQVVDPQQIESIWFNGTKLEL